MPTTKPINENAVVCVVGDTAMTPRASSAATGSGRSDNRRIRRSS